MALIIQKRAGPVEQSGRSPLSSRPARSTKQVPDTCLENQRETVFPSHSRAPVGCFLWGSCGFHFPLHPNFCFLLWAV